MDQQQWKDKLCTRIFVIVPPWQGTPNWSIGGSHLWHGRVSLLLQGWVTPQWWKVHVGSHVTPIEVAFSTDPSWSYLSASHIANRFSTVFLQFSNIFWSKISTWQNDVYSVFVFDYLIFIHEDFIFLVLLFLIVLIMFFEIIFNRFNFCSTNYFPFLAFYKEIFLVTFHRLIIFLWFFILTLFKHIFPILYELWQILLSVPHRRITIRQFKKTIDLLQFEVHWLWKEIEFCTEFSKKDDVWLQPILHLKLLLRLNYHQYPRCKTSSGKNLAKKLFLVHKLFFNLLSRVF